MKIFLFIVTGESLRGSFLKMSIKKRSPQFLGAKANLKGGLLNTRMMLILFLIYILLSPLEVGVNLVKTLNHLFIYLLNVQKQKHHETIGMYCPFIKRTNCLFITVSSCSFVVPLSFDFHFWKLLNPQ